MPASSCAVRMQYLSGWYKVDVALCSYGGSGVVTSVRVGPLSRRVRHWCCAQLPRPNSPDHLLSLSRIGLLNLVAPIRPLTSIH